MSAALTADIDQAGLKELTGLDTPVAGVLEQNIFYVNQIMKFGNLLAVFQAHPSEANKTVVTAYMVLGDHRERARRGRISRTSRSCAISCRRKC